MTQQQSSTGPLLSARSVVDTHEASVGINEKTGKKQINQYEVIEKIGEGSYGHVLLAHDLNNDNMPVAIKVMNREKLAFRDKNEKNTEVLEGMFLKLFF